MRISKDTILAFAAYLCFSIFVLQFMKSSVNIPITKIIVSFPIEIAVSPVNITSVMFTIFWLTPEFVVIAYCFHCFTKYQQKIAIYVLTRSKSVVRNFRFIMLRIARLIIIFKSLRLVVLAIIYNFGVQVLINQSGPFVLSVIVPILVLELICIAYLIKRNERIIILYLLFHLSGLLVLIQLNQKFANLLFYSIQLKDLFPSVIIGIILGSSLFYTMTYLGGKVEY